MCLLPWKSPLSLKGWILETSAPPLHLISPSLHPSVSLPSQTVKACKGRVLSLCASVSLPFCLPGFQLHSLQDVSSCVAIYKMAALSAAVCGKQSSCTSETLEGGWSLKAQCLSRGSFDQLIKCNSTVVFPQRNISAPSLFFPPALNRKQWHKFSGRDACCLDKLFTQSIDVINYNLMLMTFTENIQLQLQRDQDSWPSLSRGARWGDRCYYNYYMDFNPTINRQTQSVLYLKGTYCAAPLQINLVPWCLNNKKIIKDYYY